MSQISMEVSLAGVSLKNPVMTASGTFGSGMEYQDAVPPEQLGAVVTRSIAKEPWEGNPSPRIAETPSGMLNAVGMQNPGIDAFIRRELPFLRQHDTRIIVNICGRTIEEYAEVAARLADESVDLLEINGSCSSAGKGGRAFAQDLKAVEKITKAVKAAAKQPVIMKLSPNVADISEMAKAAEAAGADVVSLIHTLTGMKIDIKTRSFALANRTGGLSGPAIHPVAVRMVHEAAQAVGIPVIGMGGISTAEDAIEMLLAGATAVAVGTANFYQPQTTLHVIDGIRKYLKETHTSDVKELIGAVS